MTRSRQAFVLRTVILVGTLAFGIIQTRNVAFGVRMNILVVILATPVAAIFFVQGLLLAFSKYGGWRASLVPFAWAGMSLFLALSALAHDVAPTRLICTLLAAAFAITAAVLQQRERERLET